MGAGNPRVPAPACARARPQPGIGRRERRIHSGTPIATRRPRHGRRARARRSPTPPRTDRGGCAIALRLRLTRQRALLPVRAPLADPGRRCGGRDRLSFGHRLPQQPDLLVGDHRGSTSPETGPELRAAASHVPSGRRSTCKSSCRRPARVIVAHQASLTFCLPSSSFARCAKLSSCSTTPPTRAPTSAAPPAFGAGTENGLAQLQRCDHGHGIASTGRGVGAQSKFLGPAFRIGPHSSTRHEISSSRV